MSSAAETSNCPAAAVATAAEPRRLRGHKAAATCCIASRERPGTVSTSGEDGLVCWFDLRCKDVQLVMDVGDGNEAVSSLCFKPGSEDVLFASLGKEVKSFDVRLGTGSKVLQSYSYNKEEINQIVCSSKSSFLAAADDGGEIKIIDIRQQCLYKTLRSGHSSICSSVQFLPWRPWEVITGGLDSKLVMWDFSKGRPLKVVDFGSPEMNGSNMGQCFNPAFVHSVAVPDADMLDRLDKICVVARGDGTVDVIYIESELTAIKENKAAKSRKASQSRPKNTPSTAESEGSRRCKLRLHLDYSCGGHTASVSCVAFSEFDERGKFIISGGNDKFIKLWNVSKCLDTSQTTSQTDLLHMNISLRKKVNWLCTTPTPSENLIVCDTTKVVKVYSIH
ncbi:hypothetical protein MLD38_019287 [Melastoma candidum]|uniref:Uncharacterized protein n=1 Tax=Melastoma candidum TaxID=119954 RepID=A0ACB9QYE4_9MYRT|nr:hypothetical protein MLD38_019287 [Melastoma candidum]